jgi:hypothetical protein
VLLFAVLDEAEVRQGVSVVMQYAMAGGLTMWRQKWCVGWFEGRGVSIVFIRQSGDVDV